ncbi:MAG: DUF5652 family protein [Minisyncoccia bacterium]
MMYLNGSLNLVMILLIIWTIAWKCYSIWIAARNNHKKWFIALIIFNTAGILDMIYIFYVAKKKWPDVKRAFLGVFSTKTHSPKK